MFGGPILEVVEACNKIYSVAQLLNSLKYVSLCNKSWINAKFFKSTTQTTQKEATTDCSIMKPRARSLSIQYNFDVYKKKYYPAQMLILNDILL